MATISELITEQKFREILDEYFRPQKSRINLDSYEAKKIATFLAERINIPLVKETGEIKIFIKIVLAIDSFLYDNLPNEIYDLARSLEGGIDKDEAKRLIVSLSKLANTKVNLPYIPEEFEYYAIRLVIGIIINASLKGFNMQSAMKSMANVSNNHAFRKNSTEKSLENIII